MLSDMLLSELEIIAHRGAENACDALSIFLGKKVHISRNGVAEESLQSITQHFGEEDMLGVALLSRISGQVSGNAVLMFRREDARRLVLLLGSKVEKVEPLVFTEMERSMLEETGNITISSFMNCMTSHLNRKCLPNAPLYAFDLSGAILADLLIECAECKDDMVVFSTLFSCAEENIQILFVHLPSPDSLKSLAEGLKS